MSTHNIGFYEDLTKIIFELSNIIKYAPYFFCYIQYMNIIFSEYEAVRPTVLSQYIFWPVT